MRLELYLEETALIAREQSSLLDEARDILLAGRNLSRLEQNGVLHSVQVLVENAIGKAKHILKASDRPVPLSAYDTFAALADINHVPHTQLHDWNAAIGLRNRIVHDYMNIDMDLILDLVRHEQYRFVTSFLLEPFKS